MAMVYTLVEIAREWLIENNIAAGVSLRCSPYAPLVWKTADPAGVFACHIVLQDGSMHGEMLRRLQMKEIAKKKESDIAAAAVRQKPQYRCVYQGRDQLIMPTPCHRMP